MKMRIFGIHLAVPILIGVLAVPSLLGDAHDSKKNGGKQKALQSSADSRKVIQTVLDQQLLAWNRGDLEGFMDGYLHSPDLVYLSNKKVYRGWQTVLDGYREIFKSGEVQMGTLELQETEIDLLGSDAALVWGTYRVVTPDGKQRGGFYTLVMRKLKEGWRTVYDRTSSEAQ
jgi:beta-aspartyl-peptidase (threonine type)